MIAGRKTAPEIANVLNVNQETVRKFARKRGLTIYHAPQTMETHPSWRGGTRTDRDGYVLRRVLVGGPYGYLIRQGHRRGDPAGYAADHRIVMHDKLGRPLVPGEVVHHRDGNVRNNDPDNLEVFATNADHLRATLKGCVPNWTLVGKARMTGRPRQSPQPASEPESTDDHPRSDDLA